MGGFSSLQLPALSIRPPESPVQQLGGVLALQNQVQQQQMGAVELQNARLAQQEQQTIMTAFARNNGDWDQTLADIKSSVRPETWIPLQSQVVAGKIQLAQLADKDLDVRQKQVGILSDSLDSLLAEPDVTKRAAMLPGLFAQAHAAGIPIDKVAPALSQLPDLSDASLKPLKMGMVGEAKFYSDEKAYREAASMPTVAQAQQKNQAELDKAVSDSLIATREYQNMPSPTEAASARAAEFLKTQSETAKNRAETANALVDAQMKKVIGKRGRDENLPRGSLRCLRE